MLFIESLYYLREISVNAECTILEVNLDVGTWRVPKTLIVNLILSLSWQNQSFDNTVMSKLFDAAEEFMNQLLRWGFEICKCYLSGLGIASFISGFKSS